MSQDVLHSSALCGTAYCVGRARQENVPRRSSFFRPNFPATSIDPARKPSWKGRRTQSIIAWPDRTLIDSGWKDKPWSTELVYILAAQAGFRGILVSGTALAAGEL
jgi:hypothetical protein